MRKGMADIGAAEICNAIFGTPVLRDGFFITAKWPVVFGNIRHTTEHQSGERRALQPSCDAKHRPVKGVEIFANLLDHQHMPRQIGHQRRRSEHRERHQIKRRIAPTLDQIGFERSGIALG
jgi:hypothetical protein